MNTINWIAWLAAVILLTTIGRRVYTQWKTRSTAGISKWLFIGQVAGSVGFEIFSCLLHNWVFLVSNVAFIDDSCSWPMAVFAQQKAESSSRAASCGLK
jgi:MtN3 and saliva related transmembrane protein